MNLIEKILANHSDNDIVKPGEIIDVEIDARAARDFGGANVVKNLLDNGLTINDNSKTFFTFDCNPGGSDQKYAANQHFCRRYARENDIKVYDVNLGIGTHLAIDVGLILPGGTFVSTDSHANIMGAIGAFGQGMGDQDIAAVWAKGKAWFKVPKSVKITFTGKKPANVSAKDIVLNLLSIYGANKLLGCSVEMYGEAVEELTLDQRITISSMGTEMGAIIILFTPNEAIIKTLEERTGKKIELIQADENATYSNEFTVDISAFVPMVANPGHPHDDIAIEKVRNTKIDSAFIGSCTNGRMEDLRIAAEILKDRKVAPGVVLKIVPATDEIWKQALDEGLINIFKAAGALVSNAGCAGCAAGQVGQNGPNEITLSTGNRNFSGKQGKGSVYLASPATVAASAVAGFITTPDEVPEIPAEFIKTGENLGNVVAKVKSDNIPTVFEGRVWVIEEDDIDTDMIFHNRYLTITDINEMGQYTFDNLKGYEDFAKKAQKGDIVLTNKNFGAGSSRQQAVDCFKALGIPCIIAESYGAIYERNAINAAMPILSYEPENLDSLELKTGDKIKVDLVNAEITNLENNKTANLNPFSNVQMEIYLNGGLLG
ncbi:MAG: 3-isopropylmalate dehydratase large subunit [Saprospiraceae bacterium]|nr:3-isopropylmalate dehydratase large subunit [Saprospiraceae bacterium]